MTTGMIDWKAQYEESENHLASAMSEINDLQDKYALAENLLLRLITVLDNHKLHELVIFHEQYQRLFSEVYKAKTFLADPDAAVSSLRVPKSPVVPEPPQSETLPCPHGRRSWTMCPWCLGINNQVKVVIDGREE